MSAVPVALVTATPVASIVTTLLSDVFQVAVEV